jgi:hypothetical protein
MDHFWKKTMLSEGGCRVWTAGKFKDGYGGYFLSGKMQRAHRVAWVAANGPIEDGLQVLHRCDNPTCVNPDHLFLGTIADNMKDRHQKGRSISPENAPTAKLTPVKVREIRNSPLSPSELAKIYNVTLSNICKILRGDTWKEV